MWWKNLKFICLYMFFVFNFINVFAQNYECNDNETPQQNLSLANFVGDYELISCLKTKRTPYKNISIELEDEKHAYINKVLYRLGIKTKNITSGAMLRSGHLYTTFTTTSIKANRLSVTQKTNYKNCLGEKILGDSDAVYLKEYYEFDPCTLTLTVFKKNLGTCVYSMIK